VADPAKRSHETANESPHPGMTAPGEAAVVGQGLGETHSSNEAFYQLAPVVSVS